MTASQDRQESEDNQESQTESQTETQTESQTESHQIDEFYSDLPKEYQQMIKESGYIALRNCIQGQKRMVLLVHFLLNSIKPQILKSDQNSLEEEIKQTLSKYIQKEATNEDCNKTLRKGLKNFLLENVSRPLPEKEIQQLETISNDKEDLVNKIYNLTETEFPEEVEIIGSFILDEEKGSNEPIDQKIEYNDGRVYEGGMLNGKKNGKGKLTL